MARSVSYASGGKSITAELFEPAPPPATPTGVVVVAYGSDGLVDNENGPWKTMIEGYAQALAQDGFVALIPDFLVRTQAPRRASQSSPPWGRFVTSGRPRSRTRSTSPRA